MDIIAEAGGCAPLGGPNRTIISACRDAVIAIALPHDVGDATFELRYCRSAQRLKVSTWSSSWLGKIACWLGATRKDVVPRSFPVLG